jgi:lipoyl(octanoyl) transferase
VRTATLEVIEAGLVPYREALEWQRSLALDRIARRREHDVLLLLEHPPVVTLGRSARPGNVLSASGLDVVEIERGGDVTFHGPGQLVGYPILDLTAPPHKPDLHWYLRTLESALISALAQLGIAAARNPGYTGVWSGGGRKIASIGVHVKQWVTWHGFALNVTTDLTQFERIVPCGIPGVEMTSVEREQGAGSRELGAGSREQGAGSRELWDAVVAAVIGGFEQAFNVTSRVAALDARTVAK